MDPKQKQQLLEELGPVVTAEEYHTVCRQLRTAIAENEQFRATNQHLHRRCQLAEKAARENVERCQRAGVSLGRSLANWALQDLRRRISEQLAPAPKS